MKVTKYDHACLVIEEQQQKMVIDPGSFVQASLEDITDVQAIVITHIHADHLDEDHLETLLKNNPGAQIFSTQEVADKLAGRKVNIVTGGSEATVGPFALKFFGSVHAIIHTSIPRIQNVGVLVNDTLYYPGDSFTVPDVPVKTLVAPVSAPWLKIGEVMDFVASLKPQLIIPTHNALNSAIGEGLVETIVGGFAKSLGTTYKFIPVGESIEV
ncbi:MAG: putative Zn-dependent hydrolase of the beta-lactamase fold [Candidatus Saccharibacteria bacterium]|nr:putative Zn-dependent hydrolase of the beta-lactamase fold [Candidatus Saccharibacteria bacterium]